MERERERERERGYNMTIKSKSPSFSSERILQMMFETLGEAY
jgi:hypothetical protein